MILAVDRTASAVTGSAAAITAAAATAASAAALAAAVAQNVELRFTASNQHLANIDSVLVEVSENLKLLSRIDERMRAHQVADDLVHAVVASTAERVAVIETKQGPLLEMRKWIVGGVAALAVAATASVFNAGSNYITSIAARQALPVAAARVEAVMAVPQEDRPNVIKQQNKEPKP